MNGYEGDIAAEWAYAKALFAYRQEGDSERAQTLLTAAWNVNAHVPAYLTGKKKLSKTAPAYVSLGSEDEAVALVHNAGGSWYQTEGAITWLAKTVADLPPPKTVRSTALH